MSDMLERERIESLRREADRLMAEHESEVLLSASERKHLWFALDELCLEEEVSPREFAFVERLSTEEVPILLSGEEKHMALGYLDQQSSWSRNDIRLMRKLDPEWPR